MKPHIAIHIIGTILVVALSGCATIGWLADNGDELFTKLEELADKWNQQNPPATNAPPDAVTNAPPPVAGLPAGFPSEIDGPVKWCHPSVADWPVTSTLSASVGVGQIRLNYDKAKVWPSVDNVVGNPWAVVKINGQWYAGTWEYLRPGQTAKPMSVLAKTGGKGDHFKVSPLSSWTPRSGERFGLMVSGLNRGNLKNVKERTTVQMVTWP